MALIDVISIRDFSREDIEKLISLATEYKKNGTKKLKENLKVASIFFENSTRTRISSETAAFNLGGQINGFAGTEGTSVKKGEPLVDTVRMLESYGYQALVMRHNLAGAARLCADLLKIPVINGGDGSSGHPTQTLLDLFSIFEAQGKIDGLKIALIGDLKYGRTVHSLLQAFELFNVEVYLVSPENLAMPAWRIDDYEKNCGRKVIMQNDLKEVLRTVDVAYMTRIQRERFPQGVEGESEFKKAFGLYRLDANLLNSCAKKGLIVLHPLPRDKNNMEILTDVDHTPYAYYFEQAKNGLHMREAVLTKMLGEGLKGRKSAFATRAASLQDLPILNGSKKGEKLLYRLDHGTLIDHLEPGQGLMAYKLLGLDKLTQNEVVLSTNIRSQKSGRKDVLAIHGKELETEQLYKLALLSAKHTINIIKDQHVVQKFKANLPSPLVNLFECINPLCISRKEHNEFAESRFHVESNTLDTSSPLIVRCHYCEQVLKRGEIALNQ